MNDRELATPHSIRVTSGRELSEDEFNAVWAGLRLLATSIAQGDVKKDDDDIGSILTCGGKNAGLSLEQIDAFADALDLNRLYVQEG